MVGVVRFTRLARSDLVAIGRYIARDNPDRATSYLREIHAKCFAYADNPGMGRDRGDLATGVRSFPHGSYVIFYRRLEGGIQIVRVLHGRRDVGPAFR